MLHVQPIISFLFPPVCVHCGREGAWLCDEQQQAADAAHPPTLRLEGLDRVILRAEYDHAPYAALIQRLKYSYWVGVSAVLEALCQPLVPKLKMLPAETVIVPIPIHARRQRARGFNQSVSIAYALQQLLSWPIQSPLIRTRNTTPQASLPESKRHMNVQGAFRILGDAPKSVLLVDDVLTTGATIKAAALELRRAGTENVSAFALAKS